MNVMNLNEKNIRAYAYSLFAVVVGLGFIAWGQGFDWQFADISAYDLFPLFGILAFSIMWSHYVISAKALYLHVPSSAIKDYFRYTGFVVLASLLLHPGILIWQLWRDGFGLPPNSYLENYVAVGSKWAVMLGMFALIMFLSYELHRKFSERKWWKYVSYASDIAMIFIFFHALELGPELQEGWFRIVWFFYGASYLISVIYLRFGKKLTKEKK